MPVSLDFARLRDILLHMNAARAVAVVADILIVAYVIYRILVLIRGTRAVSLIKGLAVLFIANLVSRILGLTTVYWLLQRAITMVFVALPIVFMPELRRALEQIGRGRLFGAGFDLFSREDAARSIGEIARAASLLSAQKIGALIIIERDTGLQDFVETGVRMDAVVSAELLMNIFIPNTPLHDGSVIIRGDRIAAASCYLPLTENPNLSKRLGTRHRAALGISEQTDAVAVIVSEETGAISIASAGRLTRHLDETSLKQKLTTLLTPAARRKSGFWEWVRGEAR